MYFTYVLIALLLLLVGYAGVEETMRLIYYVDLHIKYAYIKVRMYFMEKKLRKQLMNATSEINWEKKMIDKEACPICPLTEGNALSVVLLGSTERTDGILGW